MGTVPPSAGVDAEKAALRAEFGDWSIIFTSDTGRWWATRPVGRSGWGGSPPGVRPVTDLDADTAEGLRGKLREHGQGSAGTSGGPS
ncbi:hypothetical protein AGRA3207_000530 [Actinomadura graeca]|uniref:Uncharacterized protein n=1 Tax=Actinomadura graeca TaxID=2750812 RepID=A0ABX8QMG1_9ACTN|nr:hypothetical protein [Actinomadura graeca]QXJ19919.1 hypothetical protein AGRA3207_000530 [Actinomadura graeca]